MSSKHASPHSSSAPGNWLMSVVTTLQLSPGLYLTYMCTFPSDHAEITSLFTLAAINQQPAKWKTTLIITWTKCWKKWSPAWMTEGRLESLCLYSLEDDLASTILQNLPEEPTDEDGMEDVGQDIYNWCSFCKVVWQNQKREMWEITFMKPFFFPISTNVKSGSILIHFSGNSQFFRSSWCGDFVIVLLLSESNCLSTTRGRNIL